MGVGFIEFAKAVGSPDRWTPFHIIPSVFNILGDLFHNRIQFISFGKNRTFPFPATSVAFNGANLSKFILVKLASLLFHSN